jgi:hypothetical protein
VGLLGCGLVVEMGLLHFNYSKQINPWKFSCSVSIEFILITQKNKSLENLVAV